MKIKSFGILLIIFGIFLIFACFLFSDWSTNLNFIQNIKYSTLIELSSQVGYKGGYSPAGELFGASFTPPSKDFKPALAITLGEGLLLSIFVICMGILFNREVFDSKVIIKFFPFLEK